MKKKYLLPALKREIDVDYNDCWKLIDNPYDFLINNLQLFFEPNISVFEGGSNAIPHMFEQMLVFNKAFMDDSHVDHDRAVAEWRAVLSMMALQRVCNVKLDVVRLDLSKENRNPFLKAACEFRPEDAPAFYNTTWDFLYIVRMKNVPIAIFSPITLICPAKQFSSKLNDNLVENEWLFIDKYNGKDRLEFDFRGEKREFIQLAAWLQQLEASLEYSGVESSKCHEKFDKTMKELRFFIDYCSHHATDLDAAPLRKEIYDSMKSNIRKEYSFLNNCCDIIIDNPKLRFLEERYREDIFEERILVLLYDATPNSMEKEENIYKLRALFRNILEIETDKPIIEVFDNGGKRLAACIFLPFKQRFVKELINHNIMPNEFFEKFEVSYNPLLRQIEIVLQIRGFPYCFRKKYERSAWQYIYGKDLEATYLWPPTQIGTPGWKNYYVYTVENEKTGIELSVPEADKQVRYVKDKHPEFQLCRSNSFPAYLCYQYNGISGYLPISSKCEGRNEVGSIANIIIDLGHATTSISMLKMPISGGNTKKSDIMFAIPHSFRVAGKSDLFKTVNINFVVPDEDAVSNPNACIKNMLHSFRDYNKKPIMANSRKPFEDGQILFDDSVYLNDLKQSIVSYINFEYISMDQRRREEAHIFIEQLLTYIVHQAILQECSYVKIFYLHSVKGNADGELKGLWCDSLRNVLEETGINAAGKEAVTGFMEHEALGWYIYEKMYNKGLVELTGNTLEIGINIGWKNTNVVALSYPLENELSQKIQNIKVDYALLEYAGSNISMLIDAAENKLEFPAYTDFLKIFLNGSLELSNHPIEDKIFEEFDELFDKNKQRKDLIHYQGLFDVIAMRIDKANYIISPDVFNNVREFRYFLMMITYNIYLLFWGICMRVSESYSQCNRINIHLGGNGARFLKWISNDKHFSKIDSTNSNKLFILSMERNLIDIIVDIFSSTGSQKPEVSIFYEDIADQLVKGCKARLFADNMTWPEFSFSRLDDMVQLTSYNKMVQEMNDLYKNVFAEFLRDHPNYAQNLPSIRNSLPDSLEAVINNNRKEVCKQIIDEINHIKGNHHTD